MKYFLCGLIILGLIAISGCSTQDWEDVGKYTYIIEQDVKKAFQHWIDGDDVTGYNTFIDVSVNYRKLMEIPSFSKKVAHKRFEKIILKEAAKYDEEDQKILLDRLGNFNRILKFALSGQLE